MKKVYKEWRASMRILVNSKNKMKAMKKIKQQSKSLIKNKYEYFLRRNKALNWSKQTQMQTTIKSNNFF